MIQFRYKCRLCGVIYAPMTTDHLDCKVWAMEIVIGKESNCDGKSKMSLVDMHFCGDGSIGVTDFIGIIEC